MLHDVRIHYSQFVFFFFVFNSDQMKAKSGERMRRYDESRIHEYEAQVIHLIHSFFFRFCFAK